MILDTSFLLDLKDGDEGAFGKAVELYDDDVPQRISAISALEYIDFEAHVRGSHNPHPRG